MGRQFIHSRGSNWHQHDLWSFQWWLLLVFLIVPWFIWWKYVDRKRLLEISMVGALILIITSYLDTTLSELGLWSYNYLVHAAWPRLITANFTLLPIAYMFVYQYFREWNKFFAAMVILGAFLAFAGEPLFIWLNIYKTNGWKHIYSFPIYILLGLLVKWVVQLMLAQRSKL